MQCVLLDNNLNFNVLALEGDRIHLELEGLKSHEYCFSAMQLF